MQTLLLKKVTKAPLKILELARQLRSKPQKSLIFDGCQESTTQRYK